MEAPADATAFVNFANRNFGYGRFIASCTQEEILQVCCPEFNVGMLFVGEMRDGEVVNVRGARRFARYAGYLDACLARHFDRDMQLRDLGKAIAAFGALRAARGGGGGDDDDGDVVVSTGRWGCGVFGGVPAHKFLQQLIAASLAGVRLAFSTFGQPDGCDELLEKIGRTQLSVGQAWELLGACDSNSAFQGRMRALGGAAVPPPPPSSSPAPPKVEEKTTVTWGKIEDVPWATSGFW